MGYGQPFAYTCESIEQKRKGREKRVVKHGQLVATN